MSAAMQRQTSSSSNEKRGLPTATAVNVPGIVVPGIVLTQAGDLDPEHNHDHEAQLPPPSPKQVVLLSPGVVYPGRKVGCFRGVVPQAIKQLVLLALVALAIWHLYSTLDMQAMHVPITDVTP